MAQHDNNNPYRVKAKEYGLRIWAFLKKWTSVRTWKDFLIPENPEEHPRLVRFLVATLILVIIAIGIIFIISFTVIRMATPTVRVPSVTKLDITEAITLLQSQKLQVYFEMVYDENHKKYQVIKQQPPQGSSVREGREVNLIISLGQDQYLVPKLCGLTKTEAIIILNQNRIPYVIQVIPAGNKVVDQIIALSIPVGESTPRDTVLSITLTDAILANQYRMDNFVRQPLEFAANTLLNNRITPIIITTNIDSLSDDGIVLEQNVLHGNILMKNTSVILTVGIYTYNEGEREKMKWNVFYFSIPKIQKFHKQVIITNEDGTLEDVSEGEQVTAKYYRAVLEDELGRMQTIYERMGAEGSSFIRVFKAYGKAKVYVYANEEIIGSQEYNNQ